MNVMFNAVLDDAGRPRVRMEFPAECPAHLITAECRKTMTSLVGPFSDNNYVKGSLHVVFESQCCAQVETERNIDGSLDVIWIFHKSPPADSALMQMLAGGVDRKTAN